MITRGWGTAEGVACALIAALWSETGHASAPDDHSSNPYFILDHVVDVAVEMPPEDWEHLRRQTRTFPDILIGDCLARPQPSVFSWFAATVTVDGETHTDVGVRKKGFLGSLSDEKPSLKVRFDKFVEGQLLGKLMQRLTLNNSVQDASMINTCMALQIFANAGLPAPRCNFATVSVNDEELGLYVHVESMKSAFLERSFADPNGNLYEGTLSDFRPGWHGTFQKKTNEDEADWSDVDEVVEALHDPSPVGIDRLGAIVDIAAFLRFWAAEVLVGHWDGYAGNRNNFFIYRPDAGHFTFIPWGIDQAFKSIDGPFDNFVSPPSVTAHGAIAHRLYRNESTRSAYLLQLRDLLDSVWQEEELLARVDEMAAIVQAYASPDRRRRAGADTERVRRFIRNRRSKVLADIDPQPPAWPWPLSSPQICWPQVGKFDIAFETTWGSNESEESSQQGSVTLTDYQLAGGRPRFERVWATAGVDEDEARRERRLEMATISILGIRSDNDLDILTVSLPADLVKSNTSLALDRDGVEGLHLVLPPPYRSPTTFELLARGGIEFAEAGTEPGARISGRLHGSIFSYNNYATPLDIAAVDVGLIINEIAARGEPFDWFELYNGSDTPVQLSEFLFADDLRDESRRTPFPANVVIESGSYLQIRLNDDWPGFALGSGEELGIWTMEGEPVAWIDWEEEQSDVGASFARMPDITGGFRLVDRPTPGGPNHVETAVTAQTVVMSPDVFRLRGNWPNPFNTSTGIAFDLPEAAPVQLSILDVLGRRVRVLHSGENRAPGTYRTVWDGRDDHGRPVASGVYLFRLTVGRAPTATGRMMLIR